MAAVSLRLKLASGVVAAILVLVVGGATFYGLQESGRAAAATAHTAEVRTELERARGTMLSAESGQRGYIITGDSAYLRPYITARPEIRHELSNLRVLLDSSPVQLVRLDSLELAADGKLAELNSTITLHDVGQRDSALRVIRSDTGRRLMVRAESLLAGMQSYEDAILRNRQDAYTSRRTLVALTAIIGSLIAATLSLLSMLAIRGGVVELERARDTIQSQSEALAVQLEESHAMAEELAVANSELQSANTAAESARERFERLLESTDEGIYGIDENGHVTFVNAAALRMLGFSRDTLLGRHAHETIHFKRPDGTPYPVADCPMQHAVQSGEAVRISDEVFWRRDGAPVPVEYVTSPVVSNGQRRGAVVAFSDITARRAAEREREALIGALGRSNQELDQFAYVASHDLKAPLRGIANLSQWIEEDLGDKVTPDIAEKMQLLRGRVNRLEALIDGILQYSRAGRVKTLVERIDIGVMLREVVELLDPPRDTTVTIDPMPTLLSERTPLQQVFLNLISNAIKYNQHAGGTVRVSCEDRGGAYYAFSVTDNGPGIEPEYHERIFGIFQTLAARDRVEGTGIGLSVVRKMVELRGGHVTVRSAVGEGATFTFEWPKTAGEQAAT